MSINNFLNLIYKSHSNCIYKSLQLCNLKKCGGQKQKKETRLSLAN